MVPSEAQVISRVSREVVGFLELANERRSLVSRFEPKAQGTMAIFDSMYKTKALEYDVQRLNRELDQANNTIKTLQGKVVQLSAPTAPPSRKRQREEDEELEALHAKVRRLETLITPGQRKRVAGRTTRQPPTVQIPAPPRYGGTIVLKLQIHVQYMYKFLKNTRIFIY